jgi:glutathione S-transferase
MMPDTLTNPIYTLHGIPDWASVIVRFALEEMGLPYRYALCDFDAGDLDTPAFRAVNPAGLLPALETPDGPMFETAAILLYLTDRHGALAPAPDSPDRAAYLSWLLFTANTVHPTLMALIHPYRLAGEASQEETASLAHATFIDRLAMIESMLVAKAPRWLSPVEPGVLGYYLGTLLRWARMIPPNPAHRVTLDAYPALRAVLAAHEARPAALRVANAEDLGPTPFTAPVFTAHEPPDPPEDSAT